MKPCRTWKKIVLARMAWLVVPLLALGSVTLDGGLRTAGRRSGVTSERGPARPGEAPPTRTALRDLDVALQYRISAEHGRDIPAFHFRQRAGEYTADRFAPGLTAAVGAGETTFRAGSSHWSLHLAGINNARAGIAFRRREAFARAEVAGNRLELGDGMITEWYVNGPGGFQQGWTIAERMGGVRGELRLALNFAGNLTPRVVDEGRGLALRNRTGREAFSLRGLLAYDAGGKELPVRFEYGRSLAIRLDDRDAQYPIVIDPWAQVAELSASDKAADDYLSRAVAVSADGSTVVAGAGYEDPEGVTNAGSLYVFVRNGSWATGTQTAKLFRTGKATNDSLPNSVAVSADGATIVAGGASIDGGTTDAGALVVFERLTGWTDGSGNQTALLTASDPKFGGYLGWSVAISSDGSTIVGGASHANGDAADSGALYVYLKGTGWSSRTQDYKLTASGGLVNDYLGTSVGMDPEGATIAGGAYVAEGASGLVNSGAVYVYEKGTAWANGSASQTAKLSHSDAAIEDWFSNDQPGSIGVSSGGATIVVAAYKKNAVYVFEKGDGWTSRTESYKLTSTDGAALQASAIRADGNRIAAGAPSSAALYIFDKGTGWANGSSKQTQKLAGTGSMGYNVGVASGEDTAVSGAWLATVGGVTNAGAAEVFQLLSAPGTQATNVTFSNVGQTQMQIDWANGSGAKRAVFVKQTTTGSASPVDSTTYACDARFTMGAQAGTGWYCVYNGTGTTVTVTWLNANTTYRTMVTEYNGIAANELYNTSTATNNPNNQTTLPIVSKPTVTTEAATGLLATSATGNGTITATGGANATNRGVIWCPYPCSSLTIGGTNVTNVSEIGDFGTGSFTASLISLSANVRYVAQAHATNSAGTNYGSQVEFWTAAQVPAAPTVGGATASTLNVAVNANGNPTSTVFCIHETGTGNYVQSGGTLGGSCVWQTAAIWGNKTVTGLTLGTPYTFEVKARNGASVETAYGVSASGTPIVPPGVTTEAAASITPTSAVGNGTITSTGGANATARGLVYYAYTDTDKVIGNAGVTSVSESGSFGTGAFTVSLTPLGVNTQYNARAWATSPAGTGYGSRVAFWTLANAPAAPTVDHATTTTLDVAVNVNSNPSGTEFCIQETGTGKYVQADGTLGAAAVWQSAAAWGTKTVTGLTAGTTYTFQVKARNGGSTETAYGPTASGITNAAPTVTTQAAGSITATAATGNGTISATNGDHATGRGVIYYAYTDTDKVIGDAGVTSVSESGSFGTGAFTASLTPLGVNTQYNARAWATSPGGTGYGSRVAFWTLANVPAAPTVDTTTAMMFEVVVHVEVNGNPAGTEFCIQETGTGHYVQADGTLGAAAVWQIAAVWGAKTLTGLTRGRTYTFQVKARNGEYTETAFGPPATKTLPFQLILMPIYK